jgi:hypothetical protein
MIHREFSKIERTERLLCIESKAFNSQTASVVETGRKLECGLE